MSCDMCCNVCCGCENVETDAGLGEEGVVFEAQPGISETWTVVSTLGANVRTGAGTCFAKVGVLTRGSTITVTDKLFAGGYTWGFFTQSSPMSGSAGQTAVGWCVLEFCKFSEQATASAHYYIWNSCLVSYSAISGRISTSVACTGVRMMIARHGDLCGCCEKELTPSNGGLLWSFKLVTLPCDAVYQLHFKFEYDGVCTKSLHLYYHCRQPAISGRFQFCKSKNWA